MRGASSNRRPYRDGAEQNKHLPRSAIVLERLETTGGGIAFGRTTSRQVVGLKMFLRGQQQPLDWDLYELSAAVEDIWQRRSLSWAVWLFWIGVVQTTEGIGSGLELSVSVAFRGKFLDLLHQAYDQGKLRFPASLAKAWQTQLQTLRQKNWVV